MSGPNSPDTSTASKSKFSRRDFLKLLGAGGSSHGWKSSSNRCKLFKRCSKRNKGGCRLGK